MKLWCILFGLFCIFLGVWALLFPQKIWCWRESWKMKGGCEPSSLYLVSVRIVGIFLVFFGMALCVLPYLV